MTGDERSSLRESVERELNADVVTELRPSSGFDWMRVGTVAAAFLGLVVVAGLATSFGSSDDARDTGGGDIAAELQSDGAGEAAPTADADTAMTTAAMDEEALEGDDMAGDSAEEGADSGTAIAPASNLVIDLGEVSAPQLEEELSILSEQVVELTESSPILRRLVDPDRLGCLDSVDDLGAVRGLATAVLDGTDIEAYVTIDGDTTVYASSDCDTIDLD